VNKPTLHLRRRSIASRLVVVLIALAALCAAAPADAQQKKLVPDSVPLAPTVRRAVDDKLLKDPERESLRIFHGLFGELSEDSKKSAAYKLATWDIADESLSQDSTPKLLRAEAALDRGDTDAALKLLEGDTSPRAQLLTGKAHVDDGHFDLALKTLTPLREALRGKSDAPAADVAAMAEATALLASLEGRSADYQFALDQLLRAQQQVDRFYWPALVLQGELLLDKDNPDEAVAALHQALALNPKSSDAYYLLGRLALRGYDFASVATASAKLRAIQPKHVLADVLDVEALLLQKDAVAAQALLAEAIKRYPHHRRLLACVPAAAAIRYDVEGLTAGLESFDRVAGRSPLALYVTGLYLSQARQYEAGEQLLKQAIERQPNWGQPHVELGLLLSQGGKEEEALAELRRVALLDPYNKRAINSLKMHEELAGYHFVQSPHFIVKYRDLIDRALAEDMPEQLERFYNEVTSDFDYKLRRKTLIEIMADKRWFAVRITGMPDIWTIGACTGNIIAITPPREGKHQAGGFDWMRVIRHEFTHTVTLERTANRIPHWFTEACAVSEEPEPRDFNTAQLLAHALAANELFTLDQINWGFVRPRKPTDRNLAYAQAHWMFEYITERFGHDAILRMLDLSRQAVPENQVVVRATGQSAEEFMKGFKAWATTQVQAWGLSPSPPTEQVVKQLAEASHGSKAEAESKLAHLLAENPDHPDILRYAAEKSLEKGDDEASIALLLRYAGARPVGTWADARLSELLMKIGKPNEAISHLEVLDRYDQTSGSYAQTLTRVYRQLNQLDDAQRACFRALARQPYDATLRETAATIALQRKDLPTALRQVESLTWIEPDRATHFVRLAALYDRMNRPADAKAAAAEARKLDPAAPVEKFLTP
jgi:tetratricopeptide (TPR) repeat protein